MQHVREVEYQYQLLGIPEGDGFFSGICKVNDEISNNNEESLCIVTISAYMQYYKRKGTEIN